MYFITFFMTVTLTCGAIAWQHKVCLFPWVHCLKFGSNSLFVIACCFNFIKNSWSFSYFLHVCSFEMLKFSITSPSLIVCFLIWYFFKSNHIFKKAEKYNIEMHTGLFFFILLAEYMYLVLETSHIYSFKSRVIKLLDLCLPIIICVIKIICTSILKFLVSNLGNLSLAASIDI